MTAGLRPHYEQRTRARRGPARRPRAHLLRSGRGARGRRLGRLGTEPRRRAQRGPTGQRFRALFGGVPGPGRKRAEK